MLGGGARNDLGNPARPGVKDVVELEFEDGGGLVDGAEDGEVRRRVEVLRQEVGDQGCRVGRLFGGLRVSVAQTGLVRLVRRKLRHGMGGGRETNLDERGASGCDGSEERDQQERDRVCVVHTRAGVSPRIGHLCLAGGETDSSRCR